MLIDTFLYFNEEELVELRLKYLNNIVDYFVVIEADVTHQGNKKGWNFPKILNNQLKSYSNKIQYHQVNIDLEESKKSFGWIDENTKGGQSWKIENMQRNFIREACKNFSSSDIIIISDVDEIPSKDKLNFIKTCDFKTISPVVFEQFLFHLDCNHVNLESWKGSIVLTKETIDQFLPQDLRNHRNRISYFTRSGWSFSSFGGVKKVREKFESFAHTEYNDELFKSESHIKRCAETGSDLFRRKVKSKKVDKKFFPKDLLSIMEDNPKFYFGT